MFNWQITIGFLKLNALLCLVVFASGTIGATNEVRFHAWGGSAQVNQYIQWVSQQVSQQHGITINHVKLADTSDAVSRVIAEKSAGNHHNGSVDLIWINGENFAAMQSNGLLAPSWVNGLANFSLTNPAENPAVLTDFGLPTNGQEAPWGRAAMVFYYNGAHVKTPPKTAHELMSFVVENPGTFAYPTPNDYLGISFLKYLLIALNRGNTDGLYRPATPELFAELTTPLWAFLDALHPHMWRQGTHMLRQASHMQRLIDDEVLHLGFSFTAAEIPSAVNRFDLPPTIRTYGMEDGSLSNIHFVAIAYNSPNADNAKKVVNFLLSPVAQAYKKRLDVWGDDTVLDVALLPDNDAQLFQVEGTHPSALPPSERIIMFAEPHASWTDALRNAWFERYGARY